LKWAGNKLNNCINNSGQNYKLKIKSGKTKIFVIITPNNMSAIEIEVLENEMSYKIIQILSYCNKVTSEYHKSIGNLLVNRLNHLLFVENYEKKLKSFADIELLNRGFLISLKDEDTKNNTTNFGLAMEIPIERDVYPIMEEEVENEEEIPMPVELNADVVEAGRAIHMRIDNQITDMFRNLNRRAF